MKFKKTQLKTLISRLLEIQDPYGAMEKPDSEDYVDQENNPNALKFKDNYVPGTEVALDNAKKFVITILIMMGNFAAAELVLAEYLAYQQLRFLVEIANPSKSLREKIRATISFYLVLFGAQPNSASSTVDEILSVVDSLISVKSGSSIKEISNEFKNMSESEQQKIAEYIVEELDKPEHKELMTKFYNKFGKKAKNKLF